jgi:hypothetical protein
MKGKLGDDGSIFQEKLEDIYFSGYSVVTFYLRSHLIWCQLQKNIIHTEITKLCTNMNLVFLSEAKRR